MIHSLAEGAAPTTPNLKNRRKEKEKIKDEKKRTMYLKVRVSPEEMAAIKMKFENSGMCNLSEFVRAMIFEGYIVLKLSITLDTLTARILTLSSDSQS